MIDLLRILSACCVLIGINAHAQITVEPMAPVATCGSTTLPVQFTSAVTFDPGCVFTVELSDAIGSFLAPTVIGSAVGPGMVSIPCSFPVGITPGTGWSIRVVASAPGLVGEAYLLPIQTVPPPNAGTNATATVCSNEPPFIMLPLLGGSPDVGGVWTGPNGNFMSGIFTPGISTPGCYDYTVAGLAPCANDSATLCITVSNAPSAGSNVSFNACGGPPIDMQAGLPPGGTWTFGGTPHSNIFFPGVDASGPYTYTLPGVPPCDGVTHTAWMMVDMPPNAGVDVTLIRCLSQGDVDLFAQLGGTPEAGGTWADDNATGQLTGSTFTVAGAPSGSYTFIYTVPGGTCPDAQATVTVNFNAMCVMEPSSPYPVE